MDLPLSAVGFPCRLPVVRSISGGDYVSFHGGFATFPQASFQADPAGVINSEYLTQGYVTQAGPVLHGFSQTGPPFYDRAAKRWVPVGAAQASPNGAFYAYAELNPTHPGAPYVIHIVGVANGSDRVFTVPYTPDFGSAIGPFITDFDGASVYFSSSQTMGPPQGVWRLDIATGSVSELSKAFGVAMTRGGYAWLDRIDPRDPEGPATGRSGPRSNSVVRVNLSTGQETVWYFASGQQVSWQGFDRDGNPIVSVAPGPDFTHIALRLLSYPGDPGTVIYDGTGGLSFSNTQADTGGRLWFGNDRGIYLYTPTTGLRKVFAVDHGNTTLAESIQPAGLCL
ncbi:MAG: hypothetical protein M3R21_00170 [Candidatus Dormibacteraeota bacterium]|nr:hypothetical protein [Candidatus Dormibacteraeota bacterium]